MFRFQDWNHQGSKIAETQRISHKTRQCPQEKSCDKAFLRQLSLWENRSALLTP
jgi:hypothetical protein